jgi:hypothetical protein
MRSTSWPSTSLACVAPATRSRTTAGLAIAFTSQPAEWLSRPSPACENWAAPVRGTSGDAVDLVPTSAENLMFAGQSSAASGADSLHLRPSLPYRFKHAFRLADDLGIESGKHFVAAARPGAGYRYSLPLLLGIGDLHRRIPKERQELQHFTR